MNIRTLVLVSLVLAGAVAVTACSAPATPQTPGALSLAPGNYTPLGGVEKNNQPTPSDLADLQRAENGTLQKPALVEFYADY